MKAECAHCGRECRLTDGSEVYPHRPDLGSLSFWVCDPCKAWVGCHKAGAMTDAGESDGTLPLGRAANEELRSARSTLHRKLDPIWKKQPKSQRRRARRRTYRIVARYMNLSIQDAHIGMFDLEQCRNAWRALTGINSENVLELGRYDPAIDAQREQPNGRAIG